MVSRARNFASFAKSMEDKTFVGSSISGTTTKTGTINIPLDTENFSDYQIGQSSTAGKMVDPTTGNVTLTIPQANESNKKFTLHFQIGYDNSSSSLGNNLNINQALKPNGIIYSAPEPSTFPSGISGCAFNDTGTRFYWCDLYRDMNYWADLAVPYDPKSMIVPDGVTYVQSTYTTNDKLYNQKPATHSGASAETSPMDIKFSTDGTKYFTMGGGSDRVQGWEFDNGVAFGDLREATQTTNFYFGGDENSPSAMRFKPDGTKMYVGGFAGNTIDQYTLSTAWDVSTATRDGQFRNTTASDSRCFMFLDDGSKLIYHFEDYSYTAIYELEIPWEITGTTSIPLSYDKDDIIWAVDDMTQTSLYWIEETDYDGLIFGNHVSAMGTAFRGQDYTLTLPASVKDSLPVLNRAYRYQVDLSSNNADSGSAEWYITDIRAVRV